MSIALPRRTGLLATFASIALAGMPAAVRAQGRAPVATGHAATILHSLPGADVYPESVTVDQATGIFYVGSVKQGTIFRGRVGDPGAIEVFSPAGADGRVMATGMFYANGRLAVVGRQTGLIFVYDTTNGKLLDKLDNGRGGQTFLNDIVFVPDGSAYLTDSVNPVLYRIAPDAAGRYVLNEFLQFAGTPVRYIAAQGAPGINLNGIAATSDGRYLLVNKRNENALFRIDLRSREVVAVEAPANMLNTADGIFLQGDTLYAAQNLPKTVGVVKFTADFTRASLDRNIPHPTFAFPTSVARFRDKLLVVSSQFDTAGSPAAVTGDRPPLTPFWVTEMPVG